MSRVHDLTGRDFGRLHVVRLSDKRAGDKHPRWLCVCVCGTERTIVSPSLVNGLTKSCGCLKRETTGNLRASHRMSKSPEYRVWAEAKDRCTNPNHKNFHQYGGRGIRMAAEWMNSFERFYAHIGPRPRTGLLLDRIDNEKGYEPGNVRWTDYIQQANNTRSNRTITFCGRTMNITQWEREIGVRQGRVGDRLAHGWSIERALTTPAQR